MFHRDNPKSCWGRQTIDRRKGRNQATFVFNPIPLHLHLHRHLLFYCGAEQQGTYGSHQLLLHPHCSSAPSGEAGARKDSRWSMKSVRQLERTHPPAHQIADGPVLSVCKIHLDRSQLAVHLLALPHAQPSRREAASPAPRASPRIWTSVDVHVPYDLRFISVINTGPLQRARLCSLCHYYSRSRSLGGCLVSQRT